MRGLASFSIVAAILAAGCASISGEPSLVVTVQWDGDALPLPELPIEAGRAVGCCAPGEELDRTDRSFRVSESGGLADAVVILTPLDADAPPPTPVAEVVRMSGCRFEPHVLAIPAGSVVRFVDEDDAAHQVRVDTRRSSPSSRSAPGDEHVYAFDRAEISRAGCKIHPWMRCEIFVTDGYAAVTDGGGVARFEELPAGDYRLSMWHPVKGKTRLRERIEVDGLAGLRVDLRWRG